MIIDEIKKASMQALKEHDKVARAIYEVVLNKCQIVLVEKRARGEELVDVDVVQVLQKVVKELNEEKENYIKVGNAEEVANIERQIEVVKVYLPQMMSESEIRKEIEALPDKSIGNVMRYFKTNFAGKVDMALVQTVLKSM